MEGAAATVEALLESPVWSLSTLGAPVWEWVPLHGAEDCQEKESAPVWEAHVRKEVPAHSSEQCCRGLAGMCNHLGASSPLLPLQGGPQAPHCWHIWHLQLGTWQGSCACTHPVLPPG